jgi:hypothetical protein
VAKSAGEAVSRNSSYPLIPNESIAYKIKDASTIYVSCTVAPNTAVTWTVEQRR